MKWATAIMKQQWEYWAMTDKTDTDKSGGSIMDARTQIAEIISEAECCDDRGFGSSVIDPEATADAILAAFPQLQGWQPIETAPRDGTPIMAGYWRDEGWFCDLYDSDPHSYDAMTHGFSIAASPLTHWKPLDPPPTTGESQ